MPKKITYGLGIVIFIGLIFWCLILGENSKYFYMYLTDVYNSSIATWHYLEKYLLAIEIALGVVVAAVFIWCVIHIFGDNSKH